MIGRSRKAGSALHHQKELMVKEVKDEVARDLLYRLADVVENLELLNPPAPFPSNLRSVIRNDLVLLKNEIREAAWVRHGCQVGSHDGPCTPACNPCGL